ncbi:SPFH domain-containing protein [Phycisphaera mikurensis]|uniref:Band 7 domain-containing protein n=1 Tax=Phycisphaera mikurensis (strain NBRC 102666 / KCTC 22515 / FYK2301M01) TaxID=1142394 RepID=I0IEN4_PHYMF|nr:SPFH domain-containing protein [Phycisphaera mikurensis]MBB6441520.1 regulator of protease activity HflC (stomatin/prohibitin superfamily) [Phycisphaera mikurensis]BAM03722.1 hypothetical protein PSMK_15630 [Phycisphaera mikurensis NBRC 102666]
MSEHDPHAEGTPPPVDGSPPAGDPPAAPDAPPSEAAPIAIRAPEAPDGGVDPGQQSLADALKVSFALLKVVMIGLVVLYALSGIYRVESQEQAVELFMGRIVGEGEERVKDEGFHLAWPFPLGAVIKVPTSTQTVNLNQAFLFEIRDQDRGRTYDELAAGGARGPLNPERDGSLITADNNLVHGVFRASYAITDAGDYITNVGDAANPRDRQRLADLLESVLRSSIIRAVAATPSDDFIGGRANQDVARRDAQATLDKLGTGITLNELTLERPTMPLPVRDAYNLVAQAENRRNEAVNTAETRRRELLGRAGGAAALPAPGGGDGPLVRLVKEYELASAANDQQEKRRLGEALSSAFRELRIDGGERGPLNLSGEAAGRINRAKTERTAAVQEITAEAEQFAKLLPRWRANPELFKQLTWARTRADIFSDGSDIETFLAPEGQLYLELNRDPDIQRQRERDRIATERAEREGRPG